MKGESKFGVPFWLGALAAMLASTLLVPGRVGGAVDVDWVAAFVGYLGLMLVIWVPGLFLRRRSMALFCLFCLVGIGGTHILFDRFDVFFQDRGVAYKAAGHDVEIQGNIQYDRTHDPKGKLPGTILALLQWAELQFLFIPVFMGFHHVTSRMRAADG